MAGTYLGAPKGGPLPLAALTDVIVTSPQEGDLLRYTGGKWQNAAGLLIKTAVAVWTPADVAQDEAVVIHTLPRGVLLIDAWCRFDILTPTGTTPAATIRDTTGIINNSDPGSLSVDDWGVNGTLDVGVGYNGRIWEDDPVTLTYTAGMTPGAVKPQVTVTFLYLTVYP